MDITNSPRPTGDEEAQPSRKLANRERESMQSGPAWLCIGQGGSNVEEPIVTIQKKLALAKLLRIWRGWSGDNWFTAEQAIHYLQRRGERDLLSQIGIQSGDADEVSKRLDGIRNKIIYNFVVKRDMPYLQPVKWRILLQDKRVKIAADEQDDFIAVRKEAGLKIDPATAEVHWSYAQSLDPYGIYPDLPEELQQSGRQYFARAPGSHIWVWFGNLPHETSSALWELLETRRQEARREQTSTAGNEAPRSAA